MPLVSFELYLPLALSTHHPLQVGVAGSLLTIDPTILQFREMAFEEAYLVLICRTGHICAPSLDTEVIVHRASVDTRLGLRNQLCAPHIRVPFRSAVDGDLGPLLGVRIARVLVRRRQVDVGGHGTRTVDIILIGTDLVRPGPFVEVGRGGELIEAAIPEYITWRLSERCRCRRVGRRERTCRHSTNQRIQNDSFAKHPEEVRSAPGCRL